MANAGMSTIFGTTTACGTILWANDRERQRAVNYIEKNLCADIKNVQVIACGQPMQLSPAMN